MPYIVTTHGDVYAEYVLDVPRDTTKTALITHAAARLRSLGGCSLKERMRIAKDADYVWKSRYELDRGSVQTPRPGTKTNTAGTVIQQLLFND